MGSDDIFTPLIYQDLASTSMQPMPMLGLTTGIYNNTNLLGGVKMYKQANEDEFRKMQDKEKKDFNFLKKASAALFVLSGIGFFKFAPIKKWVSSKYQNVADWCKNLFKRKPKTPVSAASTAASPNCATSAGSVRTPAP